MTESLAEIVDVVSQWLVRTSWQAAVLAGLVVMVLFIFGRWLSTGWRWALWMLVTVRLMVPVLPDSPVSIFNLSPSFAAAGKDMLPAAERTPIARSPDIIIEKTFPLPADAHSSDEIPLRSSANPNPDQPHWQMVLIGIWLAGMVVLTSRMIVGNVRFSRRLRDNLPIEPAVLNLLDSCRREMRIGRSIPLLATRAVDSPALYGFLRPRILISPSILNDLNPSELRFVFLHELAHVKRLDGVTNWLMTILQTIHWFNPAVWFAFARCRAERELACDTMVLSLTRDPGETESYGQTILRLVESGSLHESSSIGILGIMQARSQIKRRITLIAGFNGRASRLSWIGALLFIAIGCTSLTDKQSDSMSNPPAAAVEPSVETVSVVLEPTVPKNAIEEMLEKRLDEVRFEATPLSDVIDYLRENSGINIFVNWRALESVGIDRTTPITARMKGVTYKKALQVILDFAGGGDPTQRLKYIVDDSVLTISSADDLSKEGLSTQAYDIRDLIVTLPKSVIAPEFNAESFNPTTRHYDEDPDAAVRTALSDELILLITETVEPDSWRDNGGRVGAIRELTGQLIVTQTPENHRQIADLLNQLRRQRDAQIRIESRYLSADRSIFQKAGLKIDLTKIDDQSPIFLDDGQVEAIMKVLRDDNASSLIDVPRVILFNGQRAYVKVTTPHSYTERIDVIKTDAGETRYEPVIKTVDSGVILDIQATASSDRKYATLKLSPKLMTLIGIDKIRFEPSPPDQELFVEIPQMNRKEVSTIVSVPFGQTLLLAGMREDAADNGAETRYTLFLVKPSLIIQRDSE